MAQVFKPIKPEQIEKIKTMAAWGLRLDQIGYIIDMSRSTIGRRLAEHPEAKEAHKAGKALGLGQVAQSFFKKCVGDNADFRAQQYYLRTQGKMGQYQDRPSSSVEVSTTQGDNDITVSVHDYRADGKYEDENEE